MMARLSALNVLCANPKRAFKLDGRHGSRFVIAVTCNTAPDRRTCKPLMKTP
ncbi:MAG: serine protein kinase RIO, partial [Stutzerimonas stutzeri]